MSPYIKQDQRQQVVNTGPETPGELNYAITALCLEYLGRPLGSPSYAARAEVYGTILAAAAEWYRRVIAPYEDEKSWANGDVYPGWLTGEVDD